jgi:hypothetical protein
MNPSMSLDTNWTGIKATEMRNDEHMGATIATVKGSDTIAAIAAARIATVIENDVDVVMTTVAMMIVMKASAGIVVKSTRREKRKASIANTRRATVTVIPIAIIDIPGSI